MWIKEVGKEGVEGVWKESSLPSPSFLPFSSSFTFLSNCDCFQFFDFNLLIYYKLISILVLYNFIFSL